MIKEKCIPSMEHTSSLSAMKRATGNKNEPATNGKMWAHVLFFSVTKVAGRSHSTVGGYHAFCWLREETHLPFKDKLNRAWVTLGGSSDAVICRDQTTVSYLQMHLNAEFFGSVWTEHLCQNFQLEQILQSSPDEICPRRNWHKFLQDGGSHLSHIAGIAGW